MFNILQLEDREIISCTMLVQGDKWKVKFGTVTVSCLLLGNSARAGSTAVFDAKEVDLDEIKVLLMNLNLFVGDKKYEFDYRFDNK